MAPLEIAHDTDCPADLPQNSLSSYDPQRSAAARTKISPVGVAAPPSPDLSVWSLDGQEALADGEPRQQGALPVYQLGALIGQGGMGQVHEAVQVSLRRVVAVKRLKPELAEDGEDPSRAAFHRRGFRQEALTTANLDHPNILPVHDFGADPDGNPLLAMKRIHGNPWSDLMHHDRHELAPEDYLRRHIQVFVEVTQAVAFAHSRGVIHRDLKPGQVMVGEYGEVLLADWGLAVVYDSDALRARNHAIEPGHLPTIDTASSPAGTPAFMAPEQTERHGKRLGPRTDVYLLGGILYQILTGRPPHQGKTPRETFLRARLGEVAPPSRVVPLAAPMPEDLEALCLKALAPDPADRVASAKEFLQGLQDYLAGASRRRESQRLGQEVADALGRGCHSYEAYSDHLGRIAQAETLWAGNEQAQRLRCQVHAGFARLALEKGDLELAEVQARGIRDAALRAEMREQVRRKRLQVEDRERHRRQLRWMLRTTITAAALGAAFFLWRLHTQRSAAMQARELARAEAHVARAAQADAARARDDAQQLANQMMTELLAAEGGGSRLEALRNAGQSIVSYFDSIPAEGLDADVLRQQSAARRNLGMVEMQMGSSEAALKTFRQYADFAARMAAAQPEEPFWRRELVLAEGMASRVLTRMDRVDEAGDALASMLLHAIDMMTMIPGMRESIELGWFDVEASRAALSSRATREERLRAAEEIMDQLAGWMPSTRNLQLEPSYPYFLLSLIREQEGDLQEALRLLERSLDFLEKTNDDSSLVSSREERIIQRQFARGRLLSKLGDEAGAGRAYARALEVSEQRIKDAPQDPDSLLNLSMAYALKGLCHLRLGVDVDVAVQLVTDGIQTAEYLAGLDPRNAGALANLMERHGDVMEASLRTGDMEAVASAGAASLAAAERLLEGTDDGAWRSDAADAFARVAGAARQAAAAGDEASARALHLALADSGARTQVELGDRAPWREAVGQAQAALREP